MSETSVTAQAPTTPTDRKAQRSSQRPVRPPRAGRSNGQWAVDGRKPLNPTEEVKQLSPPLEVRRRVEERYALEGFDSIDPDDLHVRLRWWGLYTQRKPGIDGGRTAQLDVTELEDSYFMQRVRIDGAVLSAEQVETLGEISTTFGRDTADITDRQNIQFHWIRVEDLPEIWRRLEAVGLSTIVSAGDTPRAFLLSPVAGIAADEIIDPTPVAEAIRRTYIGDPELANLPRKFKTAITGHPSLDIVHEINDISLVGVVHPELGPGYDLWVGGALSTAPRLGERLGAFVTAEQAAEVWYATIRIFRDYGYRRLRAKARMKFLLAEWGPQRFRQVLQDEYLGYELPDGPAPRSTAARADHLGVHEQKDGRFFIGVSPGVGRIGGRRLSAVARLARSVGSDRIRFTPLQNLLILDVEADKVDELVAGLEELDLQVRPRPFRRATLACTGIEFCKFAIVETKDLASRVAAELDERLADLDLDRPLSLNVNGCPNSCARIQIADIGLKGQIITVDGAQVPGFQVHLGGGLADSGREEAGLGRTVRGLKVPADGVADYVERITRRFVAARRDGETFAQWAHRAEEEELV